MLIIGCCHSVSYVCTVYRHFPGRPGAAAGDRRQQDVFLLIVNVIFLIAGCFVDANSAMYIFIPIMYPVASSWASIRSTSA